MNTLHDVKQFHELFNHPVLETPQIPSTQRCELRVNLLEEELKELKEAIIAEDIVEVADAFADIQYVLSGAIHEFGLGNLFPTIFAEVQRSNMSKACINMEEVEATINYYVEKGESYNNLDFFVKNDINKDLVTTIIYVVYRKSDLKTLKSINYSPANLSPIVLQSINNI